MSVNYLNINHKKCKFLYDQENEALAIVLKKTRCLTPLVIPDTVRIVVQQFAERAP